MQPANRIIKKQPQNKNLNLTVTLQEQKLYFAGKVTVLEVVLRLDSVFNVSVLLEILIILNTCICNICIYVSVYVCVYFFF